MIGGEGWKTTGSYHLVAKHKSHKLGFANWLMIKNEGNKSILVIEIWKPKIAAMVELKNLRNYFGGSGEDDEYSC